MQPDHRAKLNYCVLFKSINTVSLNMTEPFLFCICMTMCFVFACVKQGGQGGWWECMLSSKSKSLEKERAESGPVMCFYTRTQAGRQTVGVYSKRMKQLYRQNPTGVKRMSIYSYKYSKNLFPLPHLNTGCKQAKRMGSQWAPGWNKRDVGIVSIQPDDY